MRPKITCHMVCSIDGKVTGDFLSENIVASSTRKYYDIHKEKCFYAFLCGKNTMEESFTKGQKIDLTPYKNTDINYDDFIANIEGSRYAIAFDRTGSLGWTENKIIDDDPGYNNSILIEVLTKKVPKEYLSYLRSINLSYIICGEESIDIKLALKKLYYNFGIKTILLEGGSLINSSFLKEDLIDELSIVTTPVIGNQDSKSLFNTSYYKEFIIKDVNKNRNCIVTNYEKKIDYLYENNTVYEAINKYKKYNNLLENAKLYSKEFKETFNDFNIECSKINVLVEPKFNKDNYYINVSNEIIYPFFLDLLPTLISLSPNETKDLLAGILNIVYDHENECIHIANTKELDFFKREGYTIYQSIQGIKFLYEFYKNTTFNKKRVEILTALNEANISIEDFFIDKILVNSSIIEQNNNSLEEYVFIKLYSSITRFNNMIVNSMPQIVHDFELNRLQNTVNEYFKICIEK